MSLYKCQITNYNVSAHRAVVMIFILLCFHELYIINRLKLQLYNSEYKFGIMAAITNVSHIYTPTFCNDS